jgi:hypothetical protein
MDFARSLAVPTLFNALREAQPLTAISGYRRTENRWRHFERLPRWLENFVVLGDAACAFNPVYGQGMTVAAEGAMLLDRCLQELQIHGGRLRRSSTTGSTGSLGIEFQKRLSRTIKTPWLLATGDDFRFAETEGGRRTLITRWMHAYVDRVVYASLADPQTYQTFFEVTHLVKPIREIFTLKVISRALKT